MIARRSAAVSLAVLWCAVAGLQAVGADRPVPYDLRLDLRYGEPRGPASFLEGLERELVARLDRADCFRSIQRLSEAAATAPSDLVLRVRLDRFKEQIEYELSLAQRSRNNHPQETARRQIARAETLVRIDVQEMTDRETSIRSTRFASSQAWRPLYLEDPSEEARDRLLQDVAGNVTSYVCKGSPAKWRRWIDRARARRGGD